MWLHSGLDSRRLVQMLGDALIKEQGQWKPAYYKSSCNMEVKGEQRDKEISWLIYLNGKFHFSPETLALSIAMIDRFLAMVKVRPKYLQCVALSCFYIAAKTLEEDEVIPSAVDLVKKSSCSCCVADILRMEGIVLNKLEWNIKTVTPVDHLHIIFSLLKCYYPQLLESVLNTTPSQHLSILSRNLFNCLCNHKLARFRPITLALAVVSLELEQITPSWLSIINTVQKMAEVDTGSFICCREEAGRLLKKKNMLFAGHHFKLAKMPRSKSVKRKADLEVEDDLYDGIKRLYSDEPASVGMSCGSEVGLDPEGSGIGNYGQVQPVSAN